MLWSVLGWLYSIRVWSTAIPSNDIFHLSAGPDVFHYVLHWKISNHACVVSVDSFFVYEFTFVLCTAVSACSVISSRLVGGKSHPVYGDGIV